jgi:5-oxoprolinase (ATP-hydrolysing) subunit C
MNARRFVQVSSAGTQTSVQDIGRHGWRHLGVACAGALDPAQAALANRLVGNPADAAVLEIAMTGPTLVFARPVRIALCGARIDAHFERAIAEGTHPEHTSASHQPVPLSRPVILPAGTLRLGVVRNGLRAWLAIAGGIDTPMVLGSRSTDLRGGFGGVEGRALRAGDRLPIGMHERDDASFDDERHELGQPQSPAWWVSLDHESARDAPIRYLPSPRTADIAADIAIEQQVWRVDARSDRQGLRCGGETLWANLPEQISAPVAPGTIQLPPDGRPIVLLADAQTIGGYPRLGHVIAADLPHLAQLRAGDTLRFAAVDRSEAQAALRRRRGEIARLHWAIDRVLDRGEDRAVSRTHASALRPEN